jgi:hypothetical protein
VSTEASVEFSLTPDVHDTPAMASHAAMERKHYVYVIRHNDVPVYVGLGKGKRYRESRQNSARAIGVSPDALIVERCEGLTRGEAMKYEVDLIAQFGRRADGGTLINKALGGNGGTPGIPRTPEWRAKIGTANKGRPSPLKGRNLAPETRAKIRETLSGRRRPPETIAKMSEALRNPSPETRAKMSEAARRVSPESRSARADKIRGRKLSPEHRAKIAASGRGRKHSPESIAKMSAAQRIRSPETRAKIGAIHRGKTVSPETRAKLSSATRRHWAAKKGLETNVVTD